MICGKERSCPTPPTDSYFCCCTFVWLVYCCFFTPAVCLSPLTLLWRLRLTSPAGFASAIRQPCRLPSFACGFEMFRAAESGWYLPTLPFLAVHRSASHMRHFKAGRQQIISSILHLGSFSFDYHLHKHSKPAQGKKGHELHKFGNEGSRQGQAHFMKADSHGPKTLTKLQLRFLIVESWGARVPIRGTRAGAHRGGTAPRGGRR